jgi:hypothetical protein
VYTAEILEIVRPLVVPPFAALLLYGSYARGEQDEASDLDILQLTTNHTAPYARDNVNFTCYTPEQLLTLAKQGALFARHLVLEGRPLYDPNEFLEDLKAAFTPNTDYERVYSEVVQSIPLLAIDEGAFKEYPYQYCSTASYLLRAFVYAKAFELGVESFSMKKISNLTGDARPRERLIKLRERRVYSRFISVVNLLFELSNTTHFQREETLEALVLNMFGVCDLAVVLGLRILAGGELISYPVVRPQA